MALVLLVAAAFGLLSRRCGLPFARLPVVAGHREGCLLCHPAVVGFSPGHDPRSIGCSPCHRGTPLASDAADAHRGMVLVPGNLEGIERTCGRAGCHEAIARRVRGSAMATARGLVAVDRWAFGEQPAPDGTATIGELASAVASPATAHLRQLCAGCHLGRAKSAPGPTSEASRGGGCLACHLGGGQPATPARADPARFVHPGLTLRVRDESCFGCHSRSGRIALSYAGWYESASAAPERRLADGRGLDRTGDDVHHARGLACIDCHTDAELMGDGAPHLHEEEATRVRCTTCHRQRPARALGRSDLEEGAALTVGMRDGTAAADRYLIEDRSGEPLTNATPIDGSEGLVEIRGKLDGRRHLARPPAPACQAIAGHRRLACQSCHAAWAPRCVGCHTERASNGSWVEYEVAPGIGPPALGLRARGQETTIEPFVPGMIMTLNVEPAENPLPASAARLVGPGSRFLRLYAPAVPHTVTRAGRSCVSCHLDPAALGFGAGRLAFVAAERTGRLAFSPTYAASAGDGLPADAWIAFAGSGVGGASTRTGAHPLDAATRRRVLAVGACMTCHDPARDRDRALLSDFARSLARLTRACRTLDP